MQSFFGRRANPYNPTQIHPVLNSLADACCGMLARLVVYVGALALLAIVGIHLWDELPAGEAAEATVKAGWNVAARSHPAFAVSQFIFQGKTEVYQISRHPEGGRKDVFHWSAGDKPVAELELYRPGDEHQAVPAVADWPFPAFTAMVLAAPAVPVAVKVIGVSVPCGAARFEVKVTLLIFAPP